MSNSLALVADDVPVAASVSPSGQPMDRHFLEFVVDGQRLGRVLGPFLCCADALEGWVPVLVTDWPTDIALEDLDHLLGTVPEPALGGRTALYVCAVCGVLECGALTALVEFDDETVVWRDFGQQNNHEPFDQDDIFSGVGPFTFDRRSYTRVLEEFRSAVDQSTTRMA